MWWLVVSLAMVVYVSDFSMALLLLRVCVPPVACALGTGGLLVVLLDLLCPTTIPLLASESPLLPLLRLGDGLVLPKLPLRLLPSAVELLVQLPLLFISFGCGLGSFAVPVVFAVVGDVSDTEAGVANGVGCVFCGFFFSTSTSVIELDMITSCVPLAFVVMVVVVLPTVVFGSALLVAVEVVDAVCLVGLTAFELLRCILSLLLV